MTLYFVAAIGLPKFEKPIPGPPFPLAFPFITKLLRSSEPALLSCLGVVSFIIVLLSLVIAVFCCVVG